jgi:hypothetical protein
MYQETQLNNLWHSETIACPDCGAGLRRIVEIGCSNCDYASSLNSRDFKLNYTQPYSTALLQSQKISLEEGLESTEISPPEIPRFGPQALSYPSQRVLEIQWQLCNGDKLLDIGCGLRDQSAPLIMNMWATTLQAQMRGY